MGMSSQSGTLDQLWNSLGLDSLPADAGTAVDLDATRVPDWEQATLRPDPVTQPPVSAERPDLPRISLTPPGGGSVEKAAVHRDLVVTGLLGEGGMGRVLLAHQASLGRDVAVKVPRANASQGTINALVSEAKTTGGLEHPGVIPVYSLASDVEGNPALVMKRVDGVSWSMLLRNADDPAWGRISLGDGERIDAHIELLRQVCNAIAYAHRKGVLHRDIKPSNVLIGEFGEVYVADWGIAIRKVAPGEHRRPSLVGSPVYLAPEMVTGDDAQMDERTDVFLLGATLYELLSGEPPWRGPDLKAVLEIAWTCRPHPLPAGTPTELAAICLRAMSREKELRYASALDFREALGGFLRHRSSVELARATEARLGTLLSTLQSTSREQIYPLLSECRFGFTQALREWPQNEPARRGLSRCLEETARHELSQGNLEAARALLSELTEIPADLKEAVVTLERSAKESERRQARLEQLSQEMDPHVASRQRTAFFAVVMAAIAFIVLTPLLFPGFRQTLLGLGDWYLTVVSTPLIAVFLLSVWLGRRSILSTRLNRRLIGLVTISGVGTLVSRVVCALLGMSVRETILQNFIGVVLVCVTGGVTLHWGFFWSAGAMLAGLAASALFPGAEPPLFALASVGALVFAVLSWRGWKGEFSLENRK